MVTTASPLFLLAIVSFGVVSVLGENSTNNSTGDRVSLTGPGYMACPFEEEEEIES